MVRLRGIVTIGFMLSFLGVCFFCTGLGFRVGMSGASAVIRSITEKPTDTPTPLPTETPTPILPTATPATPEFTPTPEATQPPTATPLIHTVQAGETLSIIANRYGVTVEAIIEANGITNRNLIKVGQQLIIPAP